MAARRHVYPPCGIPRHYDASFLIRSSDESRIFFIGGKKQDFFFLLMFFFGGEGEKRNGKEKLLNVRLGSVNDVWASRRHP